METYELTVQARPQGKARDVRQNKRIPAVFYGAGKDNLHLTMDYEEFRRMYAKAGDSSIIELVLDGNKTPVLIQQLQRHPVTDEFSHIDFIFVDMNKEVTANIKLKPVGVSPAVKDLGGTLSMQKHELEVRCLPKDLVHDIEVDISVLIDFHTAIHVSDVKIPAGITVLDDPERTIATVAAPRVEEEPETTEEGEGEGTTEGEGEGEGEGDKKEGEAADGEKKDGGESKKDAEGDK